MSIHSYTRIWLHLIWGTLKREKVLLNDEARKKVSNYLYDYARDKGIYMPKNYVCCEHVHCLVDLPTKYCVEDVLQLLKGSSSRWIGQNDVIPGKFGWGRGYAAFSVSHSNKQQVINYIGAQAEHHRVKTFIEEYELFIKKNDLVVLELD